jgi:hypothetical protein
MGSINAFAGSSGKHTPIPEHLPSCTPIAAISVRDGSHHIV